MSNPVLVLATHNSGKVREMRALMVPLGFVVRSAGELGLAEPEETGASFAENAAIKSEAASRASDLPALADDSGLVVRALNGGPGVHSARWAGPTRDFRRAIERVAHELEASRATDLSAKFVCALAFSRPGNKTEIFEGEIAGALTFPPRGANGFGYDPIFVADGMKKTFGEIDPAQKHRISHRARAFAKLTAFLKQENPAR